ncbi:MAG: 3-deoxy-7-phosphoheptulonate synthase, partial [Candidatus Bathyarchaeota archaeon]|nr:3-deoxy-7-phosphoheptulonate synthase [Candidatus Bathyarchaeota archaeon]
MVMQVCDLPVPKKIRLAIKQDQTQKTIIEVNGVSIGGEQVAVMAGPCSVENEEQMLLAARAVKAAGAQILRGGAFKPRSLPYSFQGLGKEGLELLAEARDETGLPIITEVMSTEDVELVEAYTDILQIGARNMQNFSLLKKVGRSNKPVMLKRGMSATFNEWLGCAEYILSEGNPDVILCERGIRTFEQITRNTLDISAAPIIHQISHLPVIIDPSHGTGTRSLVEPMAKAAVAAGADGVMIEVHPHPEEALCDGGQSLSPE